MRPTLRKLDELLYHFERALAGTLFLSMALVMFASVVHRVFTREPGRLVSAIGSLTGVTLVGYAEHALHLVLAFGAAYAVVQTRRRETPLPRTRALGIAAVGALAVGALVAGFLQLFPNGITWGPVVSLCCMLWVGFLGASMTTYERKHLALEMGEKLWPARLAPYARGAALLCAAALCVFLLLLSRLSVADHYAGWAQNHLVGNLQPTGIPKWLVVVIFPYTFVVMTARFVGQAFSRAPAEGGPEEGGAS